MSSVAFEVLVPSHEDAAAGIAELWLDGRMFGLTHLNDDRRVVLEIREGPWVVDLGALHRAIEETERLLGQERPGAAAVSGD
jgi:hypothetical protein